MENLRFWRISSSLSQPFDLNHPQALAGRFDNLDKFHNNRMNASFTNAYISVDFYLHIREEADMEFYGLGKEDDPVDNAS